MTKKVQWIPPTDEEVEAAKVFVLDYLTVNFGPVYIQKLAQESGADIKAVRSAVIQMSMQGIVEELPGELVAILARSEVTK